MGLVEINFNCWNAKNVRDGLYLYNNLSCKLEMMLMKINAIKSKQDFLTFLDNLKQDHLEKIQQWEKRSTKLFSSNAQLGGRYGGFLCKYPTATTRAHAMENFCRYFNGWKIYE